MNFGREDYNRRITDLEEIIPFNEPVFLLRATDPAALEALSTYCFRAEAIGIDAATAESLRRHTNLFRDWARDNSLTKPPTAPAPDSAIPVEQAPEEEIISLPPSLDDPVNHPSHYTSGGIECIEALQAALTAEEFRGFCKGNAIKYVWRERLKNEDEDLQKAGWYLKRVGGERD